MQGSLASYDDASVALDVARANRHAAKWLSAPNAPAFAIAGVRLAFEGVTDANGTGVGLDDVVATDRVRVVGKLSRPKRGCPAGEQLLKLRVVKVTREAPEPAELPAA